MEEKKTIYQKPVINILAANSGIELGKGSTDLAGAKPFNPGFSWDDDDWNPWED